MRIQLFRFALLLSLTALINGCQSGTQSPDVSHIEINPELIRFEKILREIDTNDLQREVDAISTNYADFTDVFFYQIIADPRRADDVYESAKVHLKDTFITGLYADCENEFGSFGPYEESLLQALKYFHHYFPQFPVPDIYTCVSGFEVGAFTIGNNLLGIGLEFYLGADYPKYDPTLFPEYIRRTMDKEHLVAKTIQSLIANYLGEARGTQLLDFMIRNGIELYIKKKLLPESPDEIIHEFTKDQMTWLENNESQIWAHLLEEELLHSTNYRQFQKLISPSPNAPNMPPEAPGRVANWIGYQIIDSYIKRHSEVSLIDLLTFENAQKILAESRYKPRQSI